MLSAAAPYVAAKWRCQSHVGRVGELDHVEEALRAAVVADHEQLGMSGRER